MYAYLSKDGLYMDRNLNLILIKMEFDKEIIEDLIVINKDSKVFDKLDISKDFTLIAPKYHTCINEVMEIVKITPDDMSSTFVEFIKNNTDSNTQCIVLTMIGIIESSRLSNIKISKRTVRKDLGNHIPSFKDPIHSDYKDINSIANIFMPDILDYLYSLNNVYDKNNILCNYLHESKVTYSIVRKAITDYLNTFGFYVFRDTINEHVLIIKNLDKGFKTKTFKPIAIYTTGKLLGLAIGPKGKNINKLRDDLNMVSKYWIIPYISVRDIIERPTDTNMDDITSVYLKMITKMLKIRFMLGVKNDCSN